MIKYLIQPKKAKAIKRSEFITFIFFASLGILGGVALGLSII